MSHPHRIITRKGLYIPDLASKTLSLNLKRFSKD